MRRKWFDGWVFSKVIDLIIAGTIATLAMTPVLLEALKGILES